MNPTIYKLRLVVAQAKESGISRQQIADKMGVHVKTLEKWLRGVTSPSLHNVEAAFNACGYNFNSIVAPFE